MAAVYAKLHKGLARLHVHASPVALEGLARRKGHMQPAKRMRTFNGDAIALLLQGLGHIFPIGKGIITSAQGLAHTVKRVCHVRDGTLCCALPEVVTGKYDLLVSHSARDQHTAQTVAKRQRLTPKLLVPSRGLF